MDLADLHSVAAFAERFERQLGGAPLHALVNNAGANFMGRQPWHTAAGVAGIPQVETKCICP
jgi:NAD(P)-dependent dehydrogenase (short-subunit alcohol dehydrogenase family)